MKLSSNLKDFSILFNFTYRDKKIKILIYIFIFLFTSCALNKVERNFYDNGKIKYKINKKNNKNDGFTYFWDKNGILINKVEYLNNQVHGKWIEYYISGKVKCSTDYHYDLKHGSEICYYENGFKKSEKKFLNGELSSKVIRWKPNGELIK